MSLRLVVFVVVLTVAGASLGFIANDISDKSETLPPAATLKPDRQPPKRALSATPRPDRPPDKKHAAAQRPKPAQSAIADDGRNSNRNSEKGEKAAAGDAPPKPPQAGATAQTGAEAGYPPAATLPSKPDKVAALKPEGVDVETSEPVPPEQDELPEYTASAKAPELPIRPKREAPSKARKSEPATPEKAKASKDEDSGLGDPVVTAGPTDAEAEETRGPVMKTAEPERQDGQASKSESAALKPEKTTTPPATPASPDPAETGGAESQVKDPQLASQLDLEKILEPLRSYKISTEDEKQVRQAIALIGRKRARQGLAAMNEIKDADARRLVHWYGLAQDVFHETPEQIEAFRKANPDWPELETLRQIAERKLLLDNPGPERLQKFYKSEPPRTGAGLAGLAIVYLAAGDKRQAHELAATAWRKHHLPASLESVILKRLGSVLTAEDHTYRAHRHLFSASSSEISSARRLKKYLSKSERQKIDARIAAMRRSSSAGKLLSALPAEAKKDPGVLHSRIYWLTRKKRYSEAWDLLKLQPNDEESLIDLDAWWAERRFLLREAMDDKKTKIAYRIAKNHGPAGINDRNEAEFLAGWIALRFLKDAKTAKTHFEALKKFADGPRSRSRAHYWLGRTAMALGDSSAAARHFADGGKYFNTFYGQLSLRRAQPDAKTIDISDPPVPTEDEIKRFLRRSSAKGVVIAQKAGAEFLAARILGGFRKLLSSPGELVLAAELGKQVGQTQQSLRLGKTGMFFGHSMEIYAYPTHALPDFKPLRQLPEMSIFYAVTRQESEFNTQIVSHAGARGLMQVMPITAKHVARQHKIKYQLKRLLSDPEYNVKIATAYIADRMDEFKGSYVKSLAGFNAGPGRVRQWIKRLGDPSDPRVDPIDWIERLPFEETRKYVKKVLANVQVYRARLGNPERALQIDTDLLRGVKGSGAGLRRASN